MKKNKNATEDNKQNLSHPEDAEASIKSVLESADKQKRQPWWKKVYLSIASPILSLYKRIRLPITIKTTLVFMTLFFIAIIATAVFLIVSVKKHLDSLGMLDQQYIDGLTQMSVLIIIISIVVVSALGALFSNMLLSPVRKMIKKIDMISADDLSTRLDTVDGTTEIRELTERINKMLDNIEESFISQKKFVSDASHELKTPISVIQGYSNLLQRWGKKNEVILEEGIDSISREANNMKRIVEQLLFLAKSGSFVMICEELDLKKELTKIAEGYALLHSTREIRLSAQSNIRLKLDRNMLTECVRAIVDNAIKYSPDGTDIDITLRKTENAVRISIADRGNGIDEKDIPYIFDRFYRCDKSRHRDDSSSGLGLTIVQTIVDKMNGKIEVKSKVGVGTTFTLVFPTKEIENGKENRITM